VREWMACSPEVAGALVDLEQGHRDVAETWAPIVERFVELAKSGFQGLAELPLLGES